VDDARETILREVRPLAPLELPLAEAAGCVLAYDATAEEDVPPYTQATVEGLAVRASDIRIATQAAPVELRVVGDVTASGAPEATVGWGESVRVAAGAILPAGADCVVPLDWCTLDGSVVRVRKAAHEDANVRRAGADVRAGQVLVPAGRRLQAPELALLAGAGYPMALAHPRLRVAVLSVGNLVEPGRPTSFGATRDAGSFALIGALREAGAVPHRIGIVQSEAALRNVLLENTARADCFVCVGIAASDGGELLPGLPGVGFLEAAMYPTSGIAFGFVEEVPFFGLPASPVPLFTEFEVFVRPAVLRIMGRRDIHRPKVNAVLDRSLRGPVGLSLLVPARVAHRDGAWHAEPAS
ncbi:MAG: molybdopterin molybdotransferase MoeA, partial [Actinomycetota bacterium]